MLKTVPHTLDISNRTKNWSIYLKLVVEYDSVKKIKKIDGRFFSIVDPYRQCLLNHFNYAIIFIKFLYIFDVKKLNRLISF